MRVLMVLVVIVLLCVTIATAAVKPPDWKNMPVLSTGEIICAGEYVRGEMRDSDPGGDNFILVFYLKNEGNPYVLFDTATSLVYLDFERDAAFDIADTPGPSVGEDACQALAIIRARKKA